MKPAMKIVGGAGEYEAAAIVAAVTAVIDEEIRAARTAVEGHASDEWVRSARPDQVESFEPNGWAPTSG